MQEAQKQAALAVRRVLDGATLPVALAAVTAGGDDAGRRRSLVQELAYGTLRHWGTLEALTRRLATKPFTDPPLAALTAVALYQLGHTRAPPFAVVDRAVAAAGEIARPAAKALVNALLRRYLREREALDADVRADPVARFSYPLWWIERVRRDWPDDWEAILDAGNARPPLTVRVNSRVTDRGTWLAACAAAGVVATAVGEAGAIVDPPRPVPELPGYAEGAFSVQDAAAQLAAPLLDLADGQRVLDACAAPGGKTTQVLERADVELVALDSDATRLNRVRENLTRLRLDTPRVTVQRRRRRRAARLVGRAAVRPDPGRRSVHGVGRGSPPSGRQVAAARAGCRGFGAQQARLLDSLWNCLAPGGKLLYVTCSVFRDENDAQIDAFLARTPGALRETLTLPPDVPHRGGQCLPSQGGAAHNQDGFFYARLRKA